MGKRENEGWRWNLEWRRGRIGREQGEEQVLWEMLDSIQIREGVLDCWNWKYDGEGRYVVKKAYDFLAPTKSLLAIHFCKLIWSRLVPSKVSFFGWRLFLDRLPTKWNVQKRGMLLQGEGLMCGLCKEEVEDVNHLFFTCKDAWLVWVQVFNWWGLVVVLPETMREIAELFLGILGRIIGQEVSACIFLVVGWYLWFWRNKRVFGGVGDYREQMLERIQAKSFFWIKHKVAVCAFSFSQWQLNLVKCAAEVKRYKRCLNLFLKQKQ
ncbi:hypothetical protein SLA2020_099580 [Shorea laevis]